MMHEFIKSIWVHASCEMWKALLIKDGVPPPSWRTFILLISSKLLIRNSNLVHMFPAWSFEVISIFVSVDFEMTEIFEWESG